MVSISYSNLIVNTTYKGVHEYGKRSNSREKALIVRSVPAIVSEELWNRAQLGLSNHFLFGARNAKNRYLLRGLLKCQYCGLTFIGPRTQRPSGKIEFYYRCNGKHSARQIFGAGAKRCCSKDVNGGHLEELVWNDLARFIANPGEVLELVADKMSSIEPRPGLLRRTPEQIAVASKEKTAERDRVLALYRRGRIDDATLENQLREIEAEEESLRREQQDGERAQQAFRNVQTARIQMNDLLHQLRAKLQGGISWELKRELVEVLVDGAEISTLETEAGREALVYLRYRFNPFSSDCTDRSSSPLLATDRYKPWSLNEALRITNM